MAKILILTAAALSAGAESLAKLIAEKSNEAAADIILINADRENLSNQLEQFKADFAACKKDYYAMEKVAEELSAELQKLAPSAPAAEEKLKVSEETFTVKKQKYGFAMPAVLHKGEKITAAHVLSDEKLQTELIEMGSGFIVKK